MSTKSLSIKDKTLCVSGSPILTLYSKSLAPSSVIIIPKKITPLKSKPSSLIPIKVFSNIFS